MKNWSSLKRAEKEEWLDAARRNIYGGLEPWTEEKERAIPPRARELYYAAASAPEARAEGQPTAGRNADNNGGTS